MFGTVSSSKISLILELVLSYNIVYIHSIQARKCSIYKIHTDINTNKHTNKHTNTNTNKHTNKHQNKQKTKDQITRNKLECLNPQIFATLNIVRKTFKTKNSAGKKFLIYI